MCSAGIFTLRLCHTHPVQQIWVKKSSRQLGSFWTQLDTAWACARAWLKACGAAGRTERTIHQHAGYDRTALLSNKRHGATPCNMTFTHACMQAFCMKLQAYCLCSC